MREYIDFWRRGLDFSGVSTRKEYWMFTFYNILLVMPFYIWYQYTKETKTGMVLLVILSLYCLFTMIPDIALTVRRLHDINKSGAWFFIQFVPIVGGILLLILMCLDTVKEGNLYGYYGEH